MHHRRESERRKGGSIARTPARTILVADDDAVTIKTLTAGLQAAGFSVITAADAMQAMMVARKHKPDAVVLDIIMPGGTGLGALERLKASSATQQIPVIAISASLEPGLADQARTLGAVEYLCKPIDLNSLTELLRRLLAPPAGGP